LERLNPQYVRFRRLKAGPGRTAEYRSTTLQAIEELDASGDIVWRNDRYGAIYAVDRPTLLAQLADAIPIVQLGQVDAITALIRATPGARWYVVELTCAREQAARRVAERGDVDRDERMSAWDDTEPAPRAAITIDTT